VPGDPVAGAGCPLEAGPVGDGDLAPAVPDQPVGLELTGGAGGRRPPHSQHLAEELLGEREILAADPVAGGQQPAGGARDGGVGAGAHQVLRDLHDQGLGVPAQRGVQRPVTGQHLPQAAGQQRGELVPEGLRHGAQADRQRHAK
jgi:hypothetical protein